MDQVVSFRGQIRGADHVKALWVFAFAAFCLTTTASAQIFFPLHIFSTASGFSAPLVQGPDGTLYGTSSSGGFGGGTVFRIDPDGTHFSILHAFGPGTPFGAVVENGDGYAPVAGLVLSSNVLYGTTKFGGATGYGTAFKINTDGGGFATLHFFTNGIAGGMLYGGLVLADGALYGTTYSGGTNDGTIFKLSADGTDFTTLHYFGGTNGTFPMASMIFSGGTLYGTTQEGNNGTVFKMDTSGSNFTILHHFTAPFIGTNSDGDLPEASLLLSGSTLYGTASGGGLGDGTIFAVNTDGSGFTNLYNFTNGIDGSQPVAALTLDGNTLYGTARNGGVFPGYGTIFRINTDGSDFVTMYQFDGRNGGPAMPMAGLLLSSNTLYGTAGSAVFSFNPSDTNITVLASGSDGAKPLGGLVLSGDSFYGTTSAGGNAGAGVVFKINTNGAGFTTLHSFSAAKYYSNYYTNADGATPMGTLALSGGVLYGTTQMGGTLGLGTVFRLNTDGTAFTNLYNFTNGLDGGEPTAGVVLSGSTLYGTALPTGGATGGTVFKLNTDGTGYSHLHDFGVLQSGTNSDGYDPMGGLVLGGDMLYGAAYNGGPGAEGTLFKISTNGMGFTNIYSFNVGSFTNVFDGVDPIGGLIVSGNTLYGTTFSSITTAHSKGGGGSGGVFKVNTDGSGFVNLHTLTNTFDGTGPKGALVLSGGKLYGTASTGGSGGGGTVFQLNTDGTGFATLHTFPFQQGTPVGDLAAIGKTVYGTSEYGAPVSASSQPGAGSIFAITPTGPPSVQFTASPTNGIAPKAVQFSAPGVDDKGNTIQGWYWNFDDGTPTFTTTIITNRQGTIVTNYNYISVQNPLHTYTNNGTYTPTLIATNNNGTGVLGFGPQIILAYPASPTVHFTATPTNGIPPTTVQFSSPAVDDYGTPLTSWHWYFGDGPESTAQNPSHTYTNNATYLPSLIATNNYGATVLGIGPAITMAYPTSILNGGFETGTFTNWTRTGVAGSSISTSSQYKHSGSHGASLFASGGFAYLSQTLSTTPGGSYLVSFWMDVPVNLPGNEFIVTWGGKVLMDQTNIPTSGWTNIQFLVTATNTSTALQFAYQGLFGLDDVSVTSIQPVISGFNFSGGNLVLTNTGGLSNRAYVVLTSTNVAQPLDQWLPIATNVPGSNGDFSITATNAVNLNDRQQFYILQLR